MRKRCVLIRWVWREGGREGADIYVKVYLIPRGEEEGRWHGVGWGTGM